MGTALLLLALLGRAGGCQVDQPVLFLGTSLGGKTVRVPAAYRALQFGSTILCDI